MSFQLESLSLLGAHFLDGALMDRMWNEYNKLSVKIISLGMLRAWALILWALSQCAFKHCLACSASLFSIIPRWYLTLSMGTLNFAQTIKSLKIGLALNSLSFGWKLVNFKYQNSWKPLPSLSSKLSFSVKGGLQLYYAHVLSIVNHCAFLCRLYWRTHCDFNTQIYGAPVNFVTAPGWLMCVGWGLYLILILTFFKEPERPGVVSRPSSEKNLAGMEEDTAGTLRAPLLSGSIPQQPLSDEEEGEVDDSDYGDDKAVETFGELLKELTLPIRILLWIYFMLKFASELLISESSILSTYYFNWTTSQVKHLTLISTLLDRELKSWRLCKPISCE